MSLFLLLFHVNILLNEHNIILKYNVIKYKLSTKSTAFYNKILKQYSIFSAFDTIN